MTAAATDSDAVTGCVQALLGGGSSGEAQHGGPTPSAPGVCLAVAAPGLTATVVGGHRQVIGVPEPLPLDLATRHDLASVTKVVATVGVLMALVDGGQLDLDSPVRRFLPGFRGGDKDRITVRELLLHRGGLWEWWPTYCEADVPEEAHRVVERLPLRYEPGRARYYSDLGFLLLGRVAEEAAAGGLADVVRATVLQPLGLTQTGYITSGDAPPSEASAEIAASSLGDVAEREMVRTGQPYPVPRSPDDFARWRSHVLVGEANDGNAFHAFSGVAGHAGLFSTVPDLLLLGASWCSSLAGEGPWLPRTQEEFLAAGPDPGQSLGFRSWSSAIGDCTATAYGHTGFTGVALAVLPRHQASVVLATNRLHVVGPPVSHELMWLRALRAAHQHLHHCGLGAGRARSADRHRKTSATRGP